MNAQSSARQEIARKTMEDLTLREIAEAVGGDLIGGPETADLAPPGGCIDTRTLTPGELFFALKGEHTDGHRHLDAAFQKNAAAAVVSRDWFYGLHGRDRPPHPVILVDRPDLALGDLARAYRRRYSIPVVAITGSNGKTTTKDMAAAVLRTRYRVLATRGNLNTRLGVPLTVLNLSKTHETAVIEMGISEHDGLRYLCEIAQPTVGVITNIGPTHLEFLGSVEGVAKAKGELLDYLDESSMAILNLDDLLLSKERARHKGRLLDFGIEKICQFRGEGLTLDQEGCGQFSLQSHTIHLRVPGRHNVYNALAAAAVGSALGVPVSEAARALSDFRPSRLRSQLMEKNGIRLLNDAYNANPASTRAGLETLSRMALPPGGRRVAVLGDMLELGPTAPDAHRQVGQFAAGCVDALFALGDLAPHLIDGAVAAGLAPGWARAFSNIETLIDALTHFLRPGDRMLLKGSRGLSMERVAVALGFEPASFPVTGIARCSQNGLTGKPTS